jgi:hypothetical protein
MKRTFGRNTKSTHLMRLVMLSASAGLPAVGGRLTHQPGRGQGRGTVRLVLTKVYNYKVVSTIFNDDIYGIEIKYLEERLHVLVNILAMCSLVWWCCHQLTFII